jgi:hypothetical protein
MLFFEVFCCLLKPQYMRIMNLELCRKQSVKFFSQFTKYLDRREFVDDFNETPFQYFITIPLKNQYLTFDTISRLQSQFLIRLNRKIFTRKELNKNFELKVLPVIEKHNHIHLLIDLPDCKRLDEADDEYEFVADKILSIIKNMKLCDMHILKRRNNNAEFEFLKKVETANDKFAVINYMTKEDRELKNIDYLNIKLTR